MDAYDSPIIFIQLNPTKINSFLYGDYTYIILVQMQKLLYLLCPHLPKVSHTQYQLTLNLESDSRSVISASTCSDYQYPFLLQTKLNAYFILYFQEVIHYPLQLPILYQI